ncbi:MAG: hypothetical protein K1Y36_09590 [Blastocatellia bacterium]|nr:hypothetical protein [Blastocatellia bacterium]
MVLNYGGLKAWDKTGKPLPACFEATSPDERVLAVAVETAGAEFPITVDPIVQEAYIKASNTDGGDRFAGALAISGDTVVVGASREASNATGVNGNQADNSLSNAGAAYVFVRNGTTWSQQAYLKASNTRTAALFGTAVAISGDTVVIGSVGESSAATGVNGNQVDTSAAGAGAVYVFVRSGTTWSQQAYLKASNTGMGDNFGDGLAISGDTVVVGATGEDSNATGVNGNQANNSLSAAGAAYVFVRSGTTWSQQAYLKASNTDGQDNFGGRLAISGDTVVAGANGEDSNATGVNGNQADNSAASAGAAYVFVRNGTAWSQQAYLKASNPDVLDRFSGSLGLSGDTLVVGAVGESSNATGANGNQADNSALNAGAAYVFVRNGTVWTQQAYLKASNTEGSDSFGISVAAAGDMVLVGATGENSNATGVNGNQADNSVSGAGAAYLFVRSGTTWSQRAYLKASNTDASDSFGTQVALSGDTMVIGATGESSNATGINGNQADNSAGQSGAVYILRDLPNSVVSLNRDQSATVCSGTTVSWTVTFGDPTAGLSQANFTLVSSGLTGASITNVTGSGTIWTVSAVTGSGSGTLGLNMTSPAGATPTVTGLPFTGQTYSVNSTPSITAAAPVTRSQGGSLLISTIATVADVETPAANLVVTVTSVPAGISVTSITNTNGQIEAAITAGCTAGTGPNLVGLQVSDGLCQNIQASLTVNVTANTPPGLSYNAASVTLGSGRTITPATGPTENGSIASLAVQSQGTYTGTVSVNGTTGAVTFANAAPVGVHTIIIRATDNCGASTDASFSVTVGVPNHTVTQFYPVASTSGKTITISGTGFVPGSTQVFFGEGRLISATVTAATANSISVTVPPSTNGTGNINGYLTVRVDGFDVTTENLPSNSPDPSSPAAVFPEFILWGDVNRDGVFATNDVTLARAFLLFLATPTTRQTLSVDVVPANPNGSRGNGQLTSTDFSLLRAVSFGQATF